MDPDALRLERGGPEHLAAVAALEESCFPAPRRWSRQAWADDLAAQDRIVLVGRLPDDDTLALALSVHVVADVADLDRIMVRPALRDRGLAGRGLECAMSLAARRGAERMLLEVAADNRAALALYHRCGFGEIARRAHYYPSDAEHPGGTDALVLSADLADDREENHV